MLLTIEKVAILKRVDLFAAIPDAVLAAVAEIVTEVHLPPGETFIREGELEDWLFVVVDGRVQVHSGPRIFLNLGPGESVGELALLDPEPRAASVTTLEDTLLFRLDREPFDALQADQPEIARGIIRALCRRVRAQGARGDGGGDQTP